MGYRYWLELPLIVGLVGRSVGDIFAGALMADVVQNREDMGGYDPRDSVYSGAKLQAKPLYWNPVFPDVAYFMYGVMVAYWAVVFQAGFMHTIANPGPVFGALGVPPAVMQAVAYANILVMYWYAGSYIAEGVKRRYT